MDDSRWESFEGTPYELGCQLSMYWGRRLRLRYLKRFYDEFTRELNDPEWSDKHEALTRSVQARFPTLCREIEGMVEGAKRVGLRGTTFKSMFRLCLGELQCDLDCTSISYHDTNRNILAHNEEYDGCYPLCYARVRLHADGEIREFLSASYPFQFFGTAIGANAKLIFSGNSIAMNHRRAAAVVETLAQRVPKTVFTRLMLEQSTLARIERLLTRYDAASPANWFVATKDEIKSIQ